MNLTFAIQQCILEILTGICNDHILLNGYKVFCNKFLLQLIEPFLFRDNWIVSNFSPISLQWTSLICILVVWTCNYITRIDTKKGSYWSYNAPILNTTTKLSSWLAVQYFLTCIDWEFPFLHSHPLMLSNFVIFANLLSKNVSWYCFNSQFPNY